MTIFDSLTLAEQARQLRNPEGDIGLAVAEWLNETNRQGNGRAVELLDLQPGNHVLEIGFGIGRTVADVVAQAAEVRYAGIDISPTMVAEAARFNAALVAAGRASFHLGSADSMPFADASFDRVFSTGVTHFLGRPGGPPGGSPQGLATWRHQPDGLPPSSFGTGFCPSGTRLLPSRRRGMACAAPRGRLLRNQRSDTRIRAGPSRRHRRKALWNSRRGTRLNANRQDGPHAHLRWHHAVGCNACRVRQRLGGHAVGLHRGVRCDRADLHAHRPRNL